MQSCQLSYLPDDNQAYRSGIECQHLASYFSLIGNDNGTLKTDSYSGARREGNREGGGIVAVSLLMNILNLESGKMVGREQQSQLWVEKSEQGH
jgi:hypothetical protein